MKRTVLLSFVGFALPMIAANPNGSSAISFSSNPATLVIGNDVTITTTTVSAQQPGEVDEGKVVIQYATDGLGNPVPSANVVQWVALNSPGQNPVTGMTSLSVDLDPLLFIQGTVAGFRAHYVTGGGSPKVDTHFSDALDLVIGGPVCSGVNVAATLAAGNGTPLPGESGRWTFRITVQNCTGIPLSNVKVQGGTNGWGDIVSATASKAPNPVIKGNKRNEIVTWTGDFGVNETVYINVTMNGSIKPGAICSPDPDNPVAGSVLGLSGNWSAAYNDGYPQKSSYSGKVTLTVVCSAP